MKRLSVNLYKIVYRVTHKTMLSYWLGLVITSIILTLFIREVSIILPSPEIGKYLHIYFSVPYSVLPGVLILIAAYFNFPSKILRKLDNHNIDFITIILFIIAIIVLYGYERFNQMSR